MQSVTSKKPRATRVAHCNTQRELRSQALAQGIPQFMLRLAAAQQVCFVPTTTMPRHRHD
jgi:hypothetical protein